MTTAIVALCAVVVSAIVLAIPGIILFQKLKDWVKKRRESKQEGNSSNTENEPEVVEYEVTEAAERCIQTEPCTDLSDLYLTTSGEFFGDSIESFSEKPLIVARSISETAIPDAKTASEKSSFFYKRSLKNFSTVSKLETISDMDVSTQTIDSDQERDLQMSAWLPLEFEGEEGNGTQQNRPARYQPPVSSNNIICPRRPSRGRKDPCGCPENKQKSGNSTHKVCTIV